MEHLTSTQQKMVEENHNLIYGMAHKYKINLDEYYDVLAIGLCKAAMTFDETKGQFSTFAYVTMLNEYNAVLRHNKTYMVIPEQNLVSMNTQMISDDGNGVVEYGDLFPADVDIEKDTVETDYTVLSDNTISNTTFYCNRSIEETIDSLEVKWQLIVFWVFWILLISGLVYGFYYIDNRWLEN